MAVEALESSAALGGASTGAEEVVGGELVTEAVAGKVGEARLSGAGEGASGVGEGAARLAFAGR